MGKLLTKIKEFIKKKPLLVSLLFVLIPSFIFLGSSVWINKVFMFIGNGGTDENIIKYTVTSVLEGIIISGVAALCICYPFVLTFIHVVTLFVLPKSEMGRKHLRQFEYVTLILGLLYSVLFYEYIYYEIKFSAEWTQALYAGRVHQPIWTQGLPTVIVLSIIGLIGYFILSRSKVEKMPPLVIVLAMSAMYLGVLQCILWCVQISNIWYFFMLLYPFNCIIIAAKTVRLKVVEWKEWQAVREQQAEQKETLKGLNRLLENAAYWPLIAFVLMWPLLGIVLCILVLFGQRPDAVIKAWTETADWKLSQQIPPQNLQADEHYLCTVAAGGHAKLVKPIRMGVRHGHSVVVNRQLCIANAFEQILEERTPGFHRRVRYIYDTYGYPVARLIRTKVAADVVYIIMKPLEWIFLMVIYLCDVKPENRIVVQYLPKR